MAVALEKAIQDPATKYRGREVDSGLEVLGPSIGATDEVLDHVPHDLRVYVNNRLVSVELDNASDAERASESRDCVLQVLFVGVKRERDALSHRAFGRIQTDDL